mmetsp:Transcript_3705/g.6784  ORF Transcript_3705/g.6784 Transcript_3705/m.6784 type:complete len:148 (-) Transcript_3705:1541-1984(-)
MMLRMCFHDNSVSTDLKDGLSFSEYVEKHLEDTDGDGFKETWKGFERNLPTSGGDASVLICPEERFHPNQNVRPLEFFRRVVFKSSCTTDFRSLPSMILKNKNTVRPNRFACAESIPVVQVLRRYLRWQLLSCQQQQQWFRFRSWKH